MKVISLQHCGIMLDVLYCNASKVKFEQKSIRQMALDAGVSVMTLSKVRDILIEQKILIKEGERRQQKVYWHPNKSAPNPAMLQNIYKEFIKDAKHRVRVSCEKSQGRISLDKALQALVKLGYTGVITRSINSYTNESIDLSKIKIGDN